MSREEFQTWLKEHSSHFKGYQGWEVAHLALACGFTMADIAPHVIDWVVISRRKLKLWDSPLFEQWVSLRGYQNGKDWY